MIDPPTPAGGASILVWAKNMWDYVRSITPKAGDGLTMTRTTSGTVIGLTPTTDPRQPGPFTPIFRSNSGGSPAFKVKVTRGAVADVVAHSGDALAYFTCPNQTDGDALVEFDFASGQAVYVSVAVLPSGAVGIVSGDPCSIVVAADNSASLHYIPPVGDDTAGHLGTMLYKLASAATDANGILRVTPCLMGNNVVHIRSRSPFEATGITSGVCDLFTKFDLASGKMKYKGIKGISPIVVGLAGGVGSEILEVKMADGGINFYIRIYQLLYSTLNVVDTSSSTVISTYHDMFQAATPGPTLAYVILIKNGIVSGLWTGDPPGGYLYPQIDINSMVEA